MATEQQLHINGNFAPQQGHAYGTGDQSFGSQSGNADYDASSPQQSASANAGGNSEVPKDEVGWYFVEQYYTTLSRSPEKLFLFYNKRSQYVWGQEAEKVKVCIGQKEINDRIQDLDLQDCKVRVLNVDSQGSDKSIVIQVLGEISSKGATQRKFAQTFVLAEQPNGYFLLNDIFRYILEDEEDFEAEAPAQDEAAGGYQEPVPTALPGTDTDEHTTLTGSNDPELQKRDVEIVDHSLEQAIQDNEPPAGATNGVEVPDSADVTHAEEAPVAAVAAEEPEAIDTAEVETAPEAIAAAPAADTKPAASAPKPAIPKSWAHLVAGNRSAPPASATASSQQPKKPTESQNPVVPAPNSVVAPSEPADNSGPQSNSEWQTSEKKPRQANQTNQDIVRGFIKNVTESIDDAALRNALKKSADFVYFDIHRGKNCAFVEYANLAGFQAAVAGNPYEVNGNKLFVEERRVRPQSMAGGFSGNNRGTMGRGGRGTDRGRGGFNNGRGRGAPARGKGGPPQAA